MRLLFSPSFGQHLLSVPKSGYSALEFKTSTHSVAISGPLSSGMYYLDLQRNENAPEEILQYVEGISHSCFVKDSDVSHDRQLGEYRYKTAVAMVSTGVPAKGDKLAGYYCYHLEFNGKNPEHVRELEKRFFLGEVAPYKIAGKQPKTFREVLELLVKEYSPKTFFDKLKICRQVIFKKATI